MEFSVVIPVYNEARSIQELVNRLEVFFASLDHKPEYEILFVDDGSTDPTREIISSLCQVKNNIHCVFLRRNFGKSFALTAGFQYAKGNYIITMDGDLQDRPEEIHKLIARAAEGYDLVSGWKHRRKDDVLRVLGSRVFNYIVSCFFGLYLRDLNCGFKIYRRAVVKNILVYGQYHRFIPVLAYCLGFKVSEVPIEHDSRKYGTSRYPAYRYQGFFDLLSLFFIYRYRFSPLYFFGVVGMVLIVPSAMVLFFSCVKLLLWVMGVIPRPIDITFNRPVFALSTTALIGGLYILLTGFVCDFILHHQGRRTVVENLESMVERDI
jgi:glycosyltransferase involved in cell wall biosynthesis